MTKFVCAVVINQDKEILVCHAKETEDINQNWYIPYWPLDCETQLSKEDFLQDKLQRESRTPFKQLVSIIEINETCYMVYTFDENEFLWIGESYDKYEFRPWEMARDFSSDIFYHDYVKVFSKIKKYLEPAHARYFRIFIKLMAALVLLLLPFAVLWQFFIKEIN